MNAKRFLLLWLLSIVLSIIFIAGVILYSVSMSDDSQLYNVVEPTEQAIPEAPIVVIGSSLMRSAVPGMGAGTEGGILGDYRSHIRLAIGGISEEQSLELLDRVLEKNAKIVFLEASSFAFDFSHTVNKDHPITLLSFIMEIKELSRYVAKEVNMILGRVPTKLMEEDRNLSHSFQVRPNMGRHYPLYLRFPRYGGRLSCLLKKAKNINTEVILIAPPRAQWAEPYIGKQEAKDLAKHYRELAKKFDLLLFQPATFWENKYFIDSAHMNNIGRKKFLNELLSWWKENNAPGSDLPDPL